MCAADLTIRKAAPADAPVLLALMETVQRWLSDQDRTEQWGSTPFTRIPGFTERFARWVDQGVITVAERNGRAVGVMAAAPAVPSQVPSGTAPEGSLFIHTVLTDRDAPGRGVGAVLMAEAERQARRIEAPAIALAHWAGSEELSSVYRGYGFDVAGEYDEPESGGRATRQVLRVKLLPTAA